MRNTSHVLIGVLIGAIAPSVTTAEPLVTKGTVDAVTVYRGQAYVTRLVDVSGPAGLREVVVSDLPEHVVPGSIYAEPVASIDVRSVRYRVRPIQDDIRQDVRELDAALATTGEKLEANRRHIALVAEQQTYLDQLALFIAPTVNVELSKGVLDTDTVTSLTSFLFEQRSRLAEEGLTLRREQREWKREEELLQRKRSVLTGSSARTVREAVVFLDRGEGENAQFRLRYMVRNASWSPSYSVRSDLSHSNVVLEYYASVHQMSGESWDDVTMMLSTATPSLAARAPVLEPLRVSLSSPANTNFQEARRDLKQRQQQVAGSRGKKGFVQGELLDDLDSRFSFAVDGLIELDFDRELNQLAARLQVLDLVARENLRRERARPRPVAEEGVSLSYQLSSRTTLPSRSDQQLIRIASLPLEGEFYKLAIPVLTAFVYDEARLTNKSDVVLLAGPVSTYVDGQFVGHGDIPVVATGEDFNIGFGIDPSLRARRELIEKRQSQQGGNRVVHITYRLEIDNFGSDPVSVRLVDRLPVQDATSVALELLSSGQELSDDPLYQSTDRKNNILRWDVEVPANAVGPESFGLEFQYKLEYDKQMTLVALAGVGK